MLPPCDTAAAATAVTAAAGCFSNSLVALGVPAVLPSQPADCDAAAGEDAKKAFTPLATMTALQRLSISWPGSTAQRGVAELVASTACMPHLTLLRLSIKLSCHKAAAALAQQLTVLHVLRSLELSACGLCGSAHKAGAGGLAALATALRTLCALTHLSLAHNPLGTAGWRALAPAAAALPLTSLDLQDCRLYDPFELDSGAEGEAAAFSALQRLQLSDNRLRSPALQLTTRLPRLAQLRMHALPLSAEAEERLLHALQAKEAAPLQVLHIGDCHGTPAAAAALCRGVARWRGLRSVSLAWHPAATPPLLQLLPHLAALPCLQVLVMQRVRFASAAEVPPGLAQCSRLTQLRMVDLGCSGGATDVFSAALGALTRLQYLEVSALSHDALPVGSAAALGRALHALTGLTRLKLRGVRGACGAGDLVAGLACMTAMCDLSMIECDIGPSGIARLAPVLVMISMLSRLDLRGNRVKGEGGVVIAAALPRMHALRELCLRGCDLPPAAKQAVAQAAPAGMHVIDVSI